MHLDIEKCDYHHIASHCGHACNCHIELIILAQESCLNPTALLRYGQNLG